MMTIHYTDETETIYLEYYLKIEEHLIWVAEK